MNVLIYHDSVIPAFRYGGTQRVIWSLGKELVRLGHKVTFLCRKGSECDFARVLHIDPSLRIEEQISDDIDVVHFNGEVFPCKGKPYIVTYHGNFMSGKLDRNAVFVSANHAARYGSRSFVYNGLDWSEYGKVCLSERKTYWHFLGKAAWSVKNVRGAIDVVRRIPKARLYVLGGYRFNFKMGLRFTLTPKARFCGMIGGEEKLEILRHSAGLIFPVIWDEPFGLAMTESLYFGAPVFGTPYGSLPEIVTSDVGFLTDSASEMADRIIHGPEFNPAVCHEYAADKFNSQVMAHEYLKKYETVLSGQCLNAVEPQAVRPDARKLPWHK